MRQALIFAVALVLPVAASGAKPFKTELKNADANFSYSWSAEAAAVPALVKRFAADMRKQRAATIAGGKEFNADRKKMGMEAVGYMQSTAITTEGQSPRLLSLRIDVESYTGGAHGNHGSNALLWDRRLNREIAVSSLFLRPAALQALTRSTYCKKLDAERLKRRQGDRPGGQFDECPKYSELAIIPVDGEKDGRFDRFRFVASPYVAGPYVEGDYEIDVPVTRQLMAGLKPAFRASFEPQRQ